MDISRDAYKHDPQYHMIADYLGIDRHKRLDYEMAKKISVLHDWASDGKEIPLTKLADKIESYSKSMGINYRGKTLVDFVYQRIRMENAGKEDPKPKKQELKPQGVGKEFLRNQKKLKQQLEEQQMKARVQNEKYYKQNKVAPTKEKKQEKIGRYEEGDTAEMRL